MRNGVLAAAVLVLTGAAFGQTETVPAKPGAAQPATPAAAPPPIAAALNVGDKAPSLSINKWVKGEAVKEFEKGKVYILEFWATWCGPCRKSIPHLTEMQARYKDKGVTIIGVSSQEAKGLADVEPFVAKQGDKMAYTVAWDEAGKTSKDWMDASGQQGIPTAFIVNQEGRVAWIGHPLDNMEAVLERVVGKEFDLDKEAAKARHRAALDAKAAPLIIQVEEAVEGGRPADALKVMEEIIALDPEVMGEWAFYKFQLMAEMKDYDKAYAYARRAMDGPLKNNASVLNSLAWLIVAEPLGKRDFELALAAAKRANELTGDKDPSILETLAKTYYEKGDFEAAAATQAKAVERAPAGQFRDQLQETLAEYQKRAGKG